MTFTSLASKGVHYLRIGLAALAMFQFTFAAPFADAASQPQHSPDSKTATPIKHVIVIIGENRSFDHVFATYVPKDGERIHNLLSEHIIKLDANKHAVPGPNFKKAQQLFATDTDTFLLSPPTEEYPHDVLPAPLVGGASGPYGYFSSSPPCPTLPALTPAECAEVSEVGLPAGQGAALASGGTGQTSHTPDERITDVTSLLAGPFQLTNGTTLPYNAYAASPVHRFYQMQQQLNCSLEHASEDNPSGCDGKLFSYVEVTVGAGANGVTQPPLCSSDDGALPCFTYNYLPTIPDATTTGEGSTSLAFYNVQTGDAPYFKHLVTPSATTFTNPSSEALGPITSCSATPTRSGSATPTAEPPSHRTTRRYSPSPIRGTPTRTRVWSMKSKTPIPRPAPTTGTARTAMATATIPATRRPILPTRLPAADRIAIARIPRSPASARS